MSGGPVGDVLTRLHATVVAKTEGDVAEYIPELARVDPDLFGLAVSTLDGVVYAAGPAAGLSDDGDRLALRPLELEDPVPGPSQGLERAEEFLLS